MTSKQIRAKFIDFFVERGHLHHAAAPLISRDDPSVLFNVAGMQQFKPYYANPKKAPATNVVSAQPCLRTIDIDEVGDNSHLTAFEMLGNFSFGGYFKQEAISYAWQFLTQELKINPQRIYATYFSGDSDTATDKDSQAILEQVTSLTSDRIIAQGRDDNFWGPTGIEGPCGPTVEFYVDNIEIWNVVFNQYYKTTDGKFLPATHLGVDTGFGLERAAACLQQKDNVYDTDLYANTISKLKSLGVTDMRKQRIVADHLRAIVMLVSEGLVPKNLGREYVLRKLMRRIMIDPIVNKNINKLIDLTKEVFSVYDLEETKTISMVYTNELNQYQQNMQKGLKIIQTIMSKQKSLDGKTAFDIYATYGIPLEAQRDVIAGQIDIDEAGFEQEFANQLTLHRKVSKAGSEAKFGGHGIRDEEHIPDNISAQELEKIKGHHTATHLLQAALREVLGEHVQQKGSDVSGERLRFDFTHPTALSDTQKNDIEQLVNAKIEADLPVVAKLMSMEEARELGALAYFDSKYGDQVKVYFIGNTDGTAWSKELCGGPHVQSTGKLKSFKLVSEKSSSAGIRRIKAVVGI